MPARPPASRDVAVRFIRTALRELLYAHIHPQIDEPTNCRLGTPLPSSAIGSARRPSSLRNCTGAIPRLWAAAPCRKRLAKPCPGFHQLYPREVSQPRAHFDAIRICDQIARPAATMGYGDFTEQFGTIE